MGVRHNTKTNEKAEILNEYTAQRKGTNRHPVVIDGIIYNSISEAAKEIGVSDFCIRNRLKRGIYKYYGDDEKPKNWLLSYIILP